MTIDEIPLHQLINKIKRTIISDKPRVTKFIIEWSDDNNTKKIITSEDSQSKLDDFFSASAK
jgi:hypothetical protein